MASRFGGCWECEASGTAATKPVTSVMKSRRFNNTPKEGPEEASARILARQPRLGKFRPRRHRYRQAYTRALWRGSAGHEEAPRDKPERGSFRSVINQRLVSDGR